MQIERSQQGGCAVFAIEGRVNLGDGAREVSEALRAELEEGSGSVLIEMSRIDYMDSTGLGQLVGYFVRLSEEGRRLALVGPPPRIRKLLEVTGLDSQFRIYDTLEEAVAAEA